MHVEGRGVRLALLRHGLLLVYSTAVVCGGQQLVQRIGVCLRSVCWALVRACQLQHVTAVCALGGVVMVEMPMSRSRVLLCLTAWLAAGKRRVMQLLFVLLVHARIVPLPLPCGDLASGAQLVLCGAAFRCHLSLCGSCLYVAVGCPAVCYKLLLQG